VPRPTPSRLLPPARPSQAERRALGRALRERLPRKQQRELVVKGRRDDLVAQLRAAVEGRRPELLPIRWRRMATSPFAFFRGSAALMAADVGPLPRSGIEVQVCGDAHLLNLGAYAAPDGHLVFDLNDFDETCRGPFEWDLKRLAASLVVAGREAGHRDRACASAVRRMVRAYRESLALFAEMRVLELARFELTPREAGQPIAPIFERAARDTPRELLKKATLPARDGFARFQRRPPLLVPLGPAEATPVLRALGAYRTTLGPGRQALLDLYGPRDVASKVAGVGSVGVRAYLVLLMGNGPGDPLFLLMKEQDSTCWRPHLAGAKGYARAYPHQGRRAAEGQLRTQTVSDPFLGWTTLGGRDYLVRQWSDHKASLDVSLLASDAFSEVASLCGEVLAKAHARTGDAAVLVGYCGGNDRLDGAIARFALAYGDQVEADHARFRRALARGDFGSGRAGGAPPPAARRRAV
jgi:uncharacterized protein (DUF2252 family)